MTRLAHRLAWLTAFSLLVAVAGIPMASGWPAPLALPQADAASRPNILFIITDDQRRESGMGTMPNVISLFGEQGTEFTNLSATTPLCCPSRGSFWSGRYAHNHGVLANDSYPQPQLSYDQSTAFQSYLQASGYRTAIVGKYWNKWPLGLAAPGYDLWAKFADGYNDSSWGIDGSVSTQPGYSTDVVGQRSIRYLQTFEQNDDQPWLLYVATQAPHSPMTPSAAYANAPVPAWSGNPAVAETDKSDKPPPIRSSSVSFADADRDRTQQLRTLMSVDDMVQRVFDEMDALGETQDTLAIYTSDNGYAWGEHGRTAKRVPYTQSTQLPFFMRWPGHVAEGATDPRLTANIDVAPTLLEAAGITPTHTIDGVSLFAEGARQRLLLEYFKSPDAPLAPWASTLTQTYQYTEWYNTTTGVLTFREYYDLVNDPWQLVNLLADGNPNNDPDVDPLHVQLAADRTCAGLACPTNLAPDMEPPTVPGQPSGSSPAPGTIQISWAASSDGAATTLAYRVFRDQGTSPIATVTSSSITTVTFTDTGLPSGSSHSYSVEAFDGTNVSGRSPESMMISVASPPPGAFTETFNTGFAGWSPVRNLTIQASVGGSSPPSARAQAAGVVAYARHTLPQSVPSACVSEAVSLTSIGTSNVVLLKILRGTVNIARIVVTPARALRVRNDVSATFLSSGPALASGFHTIELCVTVGTAGSIRATYDGISMGSWTNQNLGTSSVTQFQILTDAASTFSANVDDVTVS